MLGRANIANHLMQTQSSRMRTRSNVNTPVAFFSFPASKDIYLGKNFLASACKAWNVNSVFMAMGGNGRVVHSAFCHPAQCMAHSCDKVCPLLGDVRCALVFDVRCSMCELKNAQTFGCNPWHLVDAGGDGREGGGGGGWVLAIVHRHLSGSVLVSRGVICARVVVNWMTRQVAKYAFRV